MGEYPRVSVADVKKEAESNEELAKQGVDPRAPISIPTIPVFKTVALDIVDENSKPSDGNRKSRWCASTTNRMISLLDRHCFPSIGDMQVDQIGKRELSFLIDLHSKTPSATILLIPFLKEVFARCDFEDYIGVSPIDDSFMSQLPRNTRDTNHYPALLQNNVPAAMAEIDNKTNDVALRALLKAIMLNGVRPHSAEDAEWDEIQWKEIRNDEDWLDEGWEPVDWDSVDGSTKTVIWRIPDEHMKKAKPFNVPVSRQFLEILKTMRAIRGQDKRDPKMIFASPHGGTFARAALANLLRSLPFESDTPGRKPTPHGFRSTFRTWAEKRKVLDNVAEAALSHNTGSQLVITYMRWDLLEPRARLQQAYADYATGTLPAGWIWIEPEVQAQIDAERRRADEADRRADEADARADEAEKRLARLEDEFAEIKDLLKAALLSMKNAV